MEEEQKIKSSVQIRKNQKKYRRRRIFITISNILLLCIIFILSYMIYGMYKEAKVRTLEIEESTNKSLSLGESRSDYLNNIDKSDSEYKRVRVVTMPEEEVAKKYEGYEVECRLEIPKIQLETNVLKKYSTDGLEICASKYYGPNANEVGNYCIAGHNYSKENMFNNLINLSVEDSIFLTDNKNGIVEYIIYDIYIVKPQNIEPLSQETYGKREITLITCVNYSRNRLVVKAIEKDVKK